ncbi:DUF3833 domain-containing protein [Salidesulfovibrio brasiliensis]|uniref:DUF3833 domain-containing protein n=1 Tax=Salidesulfovibrio brasiliensis TaxID=221711 RepID=UPI0006CF2BB8|nr:DUF3833 domain-containing protein [Salidesulfovibrio brasiliensis]
MDKLIIPVCMMMLMGCSAPSAEENAAGGTPFTLETFFTGELDAHGVILSRNGKVRRSFNAVMRGEWTESDGALQGTLTEDFVFNDGEKLQRRWTLTKTADNRYIGTAPDVEGTAQLQTAGNALRMDYDLTVPVSGRSFVLNVEDWLWLMEPNVVVNKSIMKKWGFRVGEIITTIIKRPESD